MRSHNMSYLEKIYQPQRLLQHLQHHQGLRPLVMTNGCFDILHVGHISYLQEARHLGATLLVAVNTDASVKRLGKGQDRPINPLEDRMAILAALEMVDWVVSLDEDTPLELVRLFRPEVLVKGGDWAPEQIVGASDVLSWQGKVASIPFQFNRSSTAIINRIKKNATLAS